MSDDLYRLIPEEGKHLADSHDTEGAFRGVYLDDETNKPCGAGEFVKVDSSELTSTNDTNDNDENGISLGQVAVAAISVVIGVTATKAYPHIKKFVSTKIAPPVKQFWNAKVRKKKSISTINCKSESTNLSIDTFLEEHRENMSSEEAKKELIEAFVLQVMVANKIKKVAQVNIVDESGFKVEKCEFADKLSNSALITKINAILSTNPQLLSQQQVTELSSFLGYNIISEGKYIPISSEIMRDKLDELHIQRISCQPINLQP